MTLLPFHCEVYYKGDNDSLIYYGIRVKDIPEVSSWAWLREPSHEAAIAEALPRLQEHFTSLLERINSLVSN